MKSEENQIQTSNQIMMDNLELSLILETSSFQCRFGVLHGHTTDTAGYVLDQKKNFKTEHSHRNGKKETEDRRKTRKDGEEKKLK